MKAKLIKGMGVFALVALSLPVDAALVGRDLDGNTGTFEAYYDTVLNITWLADANAGAGSVYDNGFSTTDGAMSWNAANAWAGSLNVHGITGWRLPTMVDTGSPGCNFGYGGTDCGFNVQTGSAATTVYSEMASLWYDTLGNSAGSLSNTGPFANLQSLYYWSGVDFAPSPSSAWLFGTGDGFQGSNDKEVSTHYAWAVRSGDVSAVPVPGAVWLLGSGLMGLVGYRRMKRRDLALG